MSKKPEEKLAPKEWPARHDAACAIVARKYCNMFGFWRACRYKPCRSVGRCSGDQGACLERGWTTVPYDIGNQAHDRMIAETPADADRFTRGAHRYPPHYKPCRSVGRCSGDQGACLERGWTTVPYDIGNQAHDRMIAETPADADRFTRGAHRYPPHSLCLHVPNKQKRRTA